jgi:hypothetical protein
MLQAQLTALALTTITLVIAGCGGSSKTATTSAAKETPPATTATTAAATTAAETTTTAQSASNSSPARTTLIVKAGAICHQIKVRHSKLNFTTQQDIVREIPLFAVYQQATIARLTGLKAPASMQQEWKRFTAAAHKLANDTTTFAGYVSGHHFNKTGAILTVIDTDEHNMKTLAASSGITGCEQIY